MARSRTGVQVDGLNRMVRELKRAGLEISDLKDVFGRIADEAADTIRRLVPRRSGRLAGTVRGNRAQRKAVVKAGRASVDYAGVINYGNRARGIEAVQFMQRGDRLMQPVAVRRLEQGIEAVITKRGLR